MSLPSLQEMLSRLVAQPSVSSDTAALDQSNLAVVGELATWLNDLGFSCEVLEVPDRPGKANLIATLGRGPGGLVLAGHTDTVPFDEELWASDPFRVVERDSAWYGLGVSDMKGFFPLALSAAARFKASDLAAPVILLATADEESTMAGAAHLLALGRPKARYAVIGEPTNMQPIIAHKGMIMMAILLTGHSGHSSKPHLGNNALDAMHALMSDLMAFRAKLAESHRNPDFEVSVPTLNLGCIHGGDSPNRICGHTELQIDVRPLPGMDVKELVNEIGRIAQRAAERAGVSCETRALFPPMPAFATNADTDFIRGCERLTGQRAGTVAFGTEGPYLQGLGMETVILGPGSIDQAHQPDEFLRLDRVQPSIELLAALIGTHCARA